jgi:hypothetical protein
MSDLVAEGTYKGSPTLSLKRSEEDRFPFTFGLGKAMLIVQNLEAIVNFVKKHGGFEKESEAATK